jgi:hypothetical protein
MQRHWRCSILLLLCLLLVAVDGQRVATSLASKLKRFRSSSKTKGVQGGEYIVEGEKGFSFRKEGTNDLEPVLIAIAFCTLSFFISSSFDNSKGRDEMEGE